MHSTDSPFKAMSSCAYNQSETQTSNALSANTNTIVTGNAGPILDERWQQQGIYMKEPHYGSNCKWQQMARRFTTGDGPTSPMVQLVDQAVSPIPPSKLNPRSSIAIQASLIKDISPLKPPVFLHHRIPSPWKPPAVSPSNTPPAPPPTPELPNKAGMGPFQSQGNQIFMRSVSPYPVSQSCGPSPVAPFSCAKLFFPPSPNDGMAFSQGNILYGITQVSPPTLTPPLSSRQSNSCPPSINPSPISVDSSLTYTPELVEPHSQIASSSTSVPTGILSTEIPQSSTQSASLHTVAESFTPSQLRKTKKQPSMLSGAGRLGETPSSSINTATSENVSRQLCLSNGDV